VAGIGDQRYRPGHKTDNPLNQGQEQVDPGANQYYLAASLYI
jgi:hypothetical protein